MLDAPDERPPRTCRSETLGIVGDSGVGRAMESIASALGMRVSIAGRKGQDQGQELSSTSPIAEGGPTKIPAPASAPARNPFDTVIRESTVLALCLPRTPDTLNLIGAPELAGMRADAIVINVSRAARRRRRTAWWRRCGIGGAGQ